MTRSLLFLPGNAPNLLIHGESLGADAVIYDLEDAVSPTEKDAARLLVRNALRQPRRGRAARIVRINALDGPLWQADRQALVPQRPDFLLPPKVDGAQAVRTLDEALSALEQASGLPEGSIRLLPLLETALGIERAFEIAASHPRVAGLLLGGEDLSADLRCKRTKQGDELLYSRGRVVCAARAAEVEAYDTPFTDVDDLEGLEQDARFAKGLGFTGKAVISPRHIDAVHAVFSPTTEEIAHAHDVLEALETAKAKGQGVVALRGKMVDAPVVKRALQVLEAEREMGQEGAEVDA